MMKKKLALIFGISGQ